MRDYVQYQGALTPVEATHMRGRNRTLVSRPVAALRAITRPALPQVVPPIRARAAEVPV